MRIKEIAERLNITPRTIRFYEEKGLIQPSKEHNQYRSFTEKDIWRLQTVISLREAGMSIEDIRAAMDSMERKGSQELHYYLELQRSVMFAKWLEIKQIIETTDYMISMVKDHQSVPLDAIYELAEGSRRLREQRSNWQDKWNFDQLASNHDQLVSTNSLEYNGYDEALELIVKWISANPAEYGLDIGAGTGNLAGKLLAQGARMAGVDQSKEMLKLCRRKHPQMETKLGNFLAIPYLDGIFDFAVSSFAFHHLTGEQKLLAMKEMTRVLKPHGRICIADVMITSRADEEALQHADGYYAILPELIEWLETAGYVTKTQRIRQNLHVVYAIPIR